jgi:hypothetical protein
MGAWRRGKRIAVGLLKMAVEVKRAMVLVDFLFWRLMAPKYEFVVGHGANTLTLVDFSFIYVVPCGSSKPL